jgi:hypothetical protein
LVFHASRAIVAKLSYLTRGVNEGRLKRGAKPAVLGARLSLAIVI